MTADATDMVLSDIVDSATIAGAIVLRHLLVIVETAAITL